MTTMSDPTQLAEHKPAPIALSSSGELRLSSLEDAYRCAKLLKASKFAPKGLDTVEDVAVALLHGAELGLSPTQSLQSIGVINGRPGIYGDTALALCRRSPDFEDYRQEASGEGDTLAVTVTAKRRGQSPIVARFSVADAKRAGLWGKPGPWSQYPERMLLFRARGFALRDAFGDVMRGLVTLEEASDYPEARIGPDAAIPVGPPIQPATLRNPVREASGEVVS